jgi:hypothetical protein
MREQTAQWQQRVSMGRAERRIEAGYQKIVLAGYVVAVEVAEAWRWLKAERTVFGPAIDYWMARPLYFSVYLLLSFLAVSLGSILGSWLGGIATTVLAGAVFLFGRETFKRLHEVIARRP